MTGTDPSTVSIRLLRPSDAADLAKLYQANRQFLAPWEPTRDEAFFTHAGQEQRTTEMLGQFVAGHAFPYLIEVDGAVAGRVNITNVSRGPFQNGQLGYWVDQQLNRRGVASRAVAAALDQAFNRHGLHRVEAATLVDNEASQRVLTRNGFHRIGLAPRYLQIAGRWQDHVLFQRIAEPDCGARGDQQQGPTGRIDP
jgi:[ribosomal protein S5]-alanine N-acetyltransferase